MIDVTLIEQVADRLNAEMASQGINRTELAKRMKRSSGYISHILRGDRNMTLKTLEEVAHALDINVTMLLVQKQIARFND